MGLTVDLNLDFDGDVSSSPGSPLLEDVSLLLASHLYAYGTPPKWRSNLQFDTQFGELALELSLVDWAALEVPLPTSVVTTSLREEDSRVEATTNPMRSAWQVSIGYSSPQIISSELGNWRFHSGLRYDPSLTLPNQAIILDVPKLHLGFAVEHRLREGEGWPTAALGARYVYGLSTVFETGDEDYGAFLTNLHGFSSQFDLTWSWYVKHASSILPFATLCLFVSSCGQLGVADFELGPEPSTAVGPYSASLRSKAPTVLSSLGQRGTVSR